MINSAKEAKALIEEAKTAMRQMETEYAHGYLAALEGPEIVGLIETIKFYAGKGEWHISIYNDAGKKATEAIAAFHKAVNP